METPCYRRNSPATRDQINKILDILRRNCATSIHCWVRDITLIQDEVSDYMAVLVRKQLESHTEFLQKFVYEILPSPCRYANNLVVSGASRLRSATGEEIHEVVEKEKCYFLKDVTIRSIFSVQDASRIIRGCVDENELSTERMKELLANVEPFIYSRTPLYESLEKAAEFFERDNSKDKYNYFLCYQMEILQTAVIKTTLRSGKLSPNYLEQVSK